MFAGTRVHGYRVKHLGLALDGLVDPAPVRERIDN